MAITQIKKEDVKVAYLLLVHDNVEQLNLFIMQLLKYGDCDIYIHVDKKNEKMVTSITKDPHIFVISKYYVDWASFSMMEGTIELMRTVIDSGKDYSHIYYGSGDDLLVKNGLYEYLANHPQAIFMDLYWSGREVTNRMRASARYRVNWPQSLKTRHDYHPARFIRILIQMLCTHGIVFFKNKLSIAHLNLKIYCGAQWFIAPFKVIEYWVKYLDENPEYIEYWRNALAPDEMFFHTLIMNSKYANSIQPALMFYKAGCTFGTKNHPVIISERNIADINKGVYFCARKFSMKNSPKAFYYYLNKIKNAYHE